ncbi:MAG: phage tail sheath family protein, partial [Thermoleophilaceae bacterium]
MPVTPTYPGVYIEELESAVRPITGVATSITAFLGFAPKGPVDTPTTVQSFTEYGRVFGGLHATSTMSYAVQHFFANGGQNAVIVRCTTKAPAGSAAGKSSGTESGPPPTSAITLEAASEGVWGDELRFRVDHATADPTSTTQFNITIKNRVTGELEVLRNLLPGATLPAAIAAQSQLVRVKGAAPTTRPKAHAPTTVAKPDPFDRSEPTRFTALTTGSDGTIASAAFVPSTPNGTGINALERADLFNLLVIPPVVHAWETGPERVLPGATKGSAAAFCRA